MSLKVRLQSEQHLFTQGDIGNYKSLSEQHLFTQGDIGHYKSLYLGVCCVESGKINRVGRGKWEN